jgi:hypothetical protein
MKNTHCHGCDAPEGREHEPGCPYEECPQCGSTGFDDPCKCRRKRRSLRVPFLNFPHVCARCGVLDPPQFWVPELVWAYYMPPSKREEFVCAACFQRIVKLVNRSRPRPDSVPTEASLFRFMTVWAKRMNARCDAFAAAEPIEPLPYPDPLDQLLRYDRADRQRNRRRR